jgi:hypothetical protein
MIPKIPRQQASKIDLIQLVQPIGRIPQGNAADFIGIRTVAGVFACSSFGIGAD